MIVDMTQCTTKGLLTVTLLVLAASDAVARRGRDGSRQTILQITLKKPAKFGDVIVPARTYRVSIDGESLSLTDPRTMMVQATVPVQATQASAVVATPSAVVSHKAGRVRIIVKHLDHVYIATGVEAAHVPKAASPEVGLSAMKQSAVVLETSSEPTELALIRRALKRYMKVIMPCADRAHRARWKSDDPRFERCVCPWTDKWRLPRVQKELRVHHPLAKGKSGLSFTVTPKGRALNCRVWIGPKPPADEFRAPTETTSAAAKAQSGEE